MPGLSCIDAGHIAHARAVRIWRTRWLGHAQVPAEQLCNCMCRWLDLSAHGHLVKKQDAAHPEQNILQDWKASHDLESQRKSIEDVRCLSFGLVSFV